MPKIYSASRYVGTKAERLAETGVTRGSRYYETDTRTTYEFDGVQWFLDVGLEHVTGGYSVISTDHGAIHGGEGFVSWHGFDAVANDAAVYVLFKTPAAKYVHLKRYEKWMNNAKAILDIYEAPDAATGTTEFTPVQRSRVSSNTSHATLHTGASAVTLGAAVHIDQAIFGGGGFEVESKSGGSRPLDLEIVLKQDTEYLFRLTNKSGDEVEIETDADLWLWLFWYEEDLA